MGQLGLPIATIGMQLQNALTGNTDAQFDEKGQEYDIRVMMDPNDRKNVDDLNSLTFTTNDGKQVRLSEFAKVDVDNAAGSLERKNRISNTTIRCYVLGTAAGNVSSAIETYLKKNPLDPNVRMLWGGEVKRQKESMGALGTAMGIGFLLVYLIDSSCLGWCTISLEFKFFKYGNFYHAWNAHALGTCREERHFNRRLYESPQGKRFIKLQCLIGVCSRTYAANFNDHYSYGYWDDSNCHCRRIRRRVEKWSCLDSNRRINKFNVFDNHCSSHDLLCRG
jgi:hypothetical protein